MTYVKAIKKAQLIEQFIKDQTLKKSLADYTAQPFLKLLLSSLGYYFEYPIKNEFILGYSLTNEVNEYTIISTSIKDPIIKAFTQSHELGHHLLHQKLLINNKEANILENDYKPEKTSEKNEANCFAANLLMPDEVLYSILYEMKSRESIKNLQCISYKTLYYRIIDYLVSKVFISKCIATKLSHDYITALPGTTKQCTLIKVWKKLKILNLRPNNYTKSEIINYNLNQINNYENILNIKKDGNR